MAANGDIFLGSVFLKSLRDQRKAILGWGLGLAGLAYLTILLFPSIGSNPEFDQLFKQAPQLKGFLGDVAAFDTLEGFVTSQFLSFIPVILAIYVVMAAAGTINGEIESGTMDFLLAHPRPRARVAFEKYLALLASLVLICLVIGLGMWLGRHHYRAERIVWNVDASRDRYRPPHIAVRVDCFCARLRPSGTRYSDWGGCGAGCGGFYTEWPRSAGREPAALPRVDHLLPLRSQQAFLVRP